MAKGLLEQKAKSLYQASGIVSDAKKYALRTIQDSVVNDPRFPDQKALQSIGSSRAWQIAKGSDDVFVVDQGADCLPNSRSQRLSVALSAY